MKDLTTFLYQLRIPVGEQRGRGGSGVCLGMVSSSYWTPLLPYLVSRHICYSSLHSLLLTTPRLSLTLSPSPSPSSSPLPPPPTPPIPLPLPPSLSLSLSISLSLSLSLSPSPVPQLRHLSLHVRADTDYGAA